MTPILLKYALSRYIFGGLTYFPTAERPMTGSKDSNIKLVTVKEVYSLLYLQSLQWVDSLFKYQASDSY